MGIPFEDTLNETLELDGDGSYGIAEAVLGSIETAASDAGTAATAASAAATAAGVANAAATAAGTAAAAANSATGAAQTAATAAATTANAAVPKSLYDANTILVATVDNTPQALSIAASRVVGRKAAGDIAALTPAELAALLTDLTGFAFAANAAMVDVATSRNWVATNTVSGNSTIVLSNGVDGMNGVIVVKHDGTGTAWTLTFSTNPAGRTVIRDLNVPDTNPHPTANSITEYHYFYYTVAGTAYVRMFKAPLQ